RRRLRLLVAGVVSAVVLIGAAIALNVSYYVGVDEGYVSVYRGLPYRFAGLDLSRVYLRTQTPATSVASEDQRLLTEHAVTSKDGALRTVEALRTAAPTPAPLPGASPGSGASPTGTGSPRPSPEGTL
ncbi:MAG TPA: hypothetical protein VJ787_08750, partial [Thermoleophilia bacterium]|nr:hypothetical protein [Thermoleophilia bacterium]